MPGSLGNPDVHSHGLFEGAVLAVKSARGFEILGDRHADILDGFLLCGPL